MKTCSKCLLSLAPDRFYKRTASTDGLNARCKECMSDDAAKQYAADRDNRLQRVSDHYRANVHVKRQYGRDYYARNATTVRTRVAARHHALYATDESFRTDMHVRTAKRRATRKNATPLWADQKQIRVFYDLARRLTRETGTRYEVDHIVPLQSDIVCGLHWELNLQVLPFKKNRAKSNRT